MPNSYFRFKQFTIEQDKCAMKVCTDSCLFGAWAAAWLQQQISFTTVLDIGAGTGLLSLMLTQKNKNAQIDAIEIDQAAAQQARENFTHSPWADNLFVKECDIKDFPAGKQYDFIISNPPFYQDDLLSQNENKNRAHHHTSLSLDALINAAKRLLSHTGYFAVLLPFHRSFAFENKALVQGFFTNKKTTVKPNERGTDFRVMLLLSHQNSECEKDEITIKNPKGDYTTAFIDLLKDYYLYL